MPLSTQDQDHVNACLRSLRHKVGAYAKNPTLDLTCLILSWATSQLPTPTAFDTALLDAAGYEWKDNEMGALILTKKAEG